MLNTESKQTGTAFQALLPDNYLTSTGLELARWLHPFVVVVMSLWLLIQSPYGPTALLTATAQIVLTIWWIHLSRKGQSSKRIAILHAIQLPCCMVIAWAAGPDQMGWLSCLPGLFLCALLTPGWAASGLVLLHLGAGGMGSIVAGSEPWMDWQGMLLASLVFTLTAGFRHTLAQVYERFLVTNNELERISKHRQQFIKCMHNEVRTPLNGLLGGSELLMHGHLDPNQRSLTKLINRSTRSLVTLIDDLMELEGGVESHIVLKNEPFNLKELLDESHQLMHEEATFKKNLLDWTYPTSYPRSFIGDMDRIRQILLNVLNNTIQHQTNANIVTTVYILNHQDDQPTIDIEIAVQQELQEQKSTPRQSNYQSSKHYRAGRTSVDITMAHNLANMMGGEISASSTIGSLATRISLTLPKAAEDYDPPTGTYIHRQYNKRALVVEDNPVNCRVMTGILDYLGITWETAPDGDTAIKKAQKTTFDIIFMDLQLPGINGYQTSVAIRKLPKYQSQVPIVAVTANIAQEDRYLAEKSGMTGFLAKPLRIEHIIKECDRQFASEHKGRGTIVVRQ